MNIGILGAGNVGGTLGVRWAKARHRVVFASRNPESAEVRKLVEAAGPNGRAGAIAEAIAASEVLALTTPWKATRDVLTGAGSALDGKVVIDATNPVLPTLDGLELGLTNSAGEQVSQWAPGARVVRAFNTVGFNVMADAGFPGGKPVMFYCGDDPAAKNLVRQLAADLGFDPQDAGPLTQARVLEPFAMLWISLAVKFGYGRDSAFQLLRR